MAIKWTSDLAVGNIEIDSQHKKLFAMVGNLSDSMMSGKGKDEVWNTIKFLEDYVVIHFGTEERHMDTYRYPGSLAHKAQHSSFVAEFNRMKADLEEKGATSASVIRVLQRVSEWLREHITKTDKLLGAYLATKQ